eukprot:COSAG01_NODE_7808_length_3047_cov_3.984396_3_plen_152_part_00
MAASTSLVAGGQTLQACVPGRWIRRACTTWQLPLTCPCQSRRACVILPGLQLVLAGISSCSTYSCHEEFEECNGFAEPDEWCAASPSCVAIHGGDRPLGAAARLAHTHVQRRDGCTARPLHRAVGVKPRSQQFPRWFDGSRCAESAASLPS